MVNLLIDYNSNLLIDCNSNPLIIDYNSNLLIDCNSNPLAHRHLSNDAIVTQIDVADLQLIFACENIVIIHIPL